MQEISHKGKLFRQQFGEIDFVGEIEIPETELENLCFSLWKSLDRINHNEDLCALLTTVVVNLAYYTRQDYDSNSFRWLVLNKLSGLNLEDNDLWVDSIGLPVLRTLKSYFQAQDIPGRANRYVRPIMQQAGVPISTVPQFVEFFLQLAKNYGVPFSYQDYQRFRDRHQVSSNILSNFLATENGFHYCKEIGRIYKNVRNRLLTAAEVENLSPRVRETIKFLQRRSGEVPIKKIKEFTLSPPQLALDRERLQLKLLFQDDESTSSSVSYSIDNVGKIYQNSYFLQPSESQPPKIAGTANHKDETVNWEVDVWQPKNSPWAVFSVTSGIFVQSRGKINPGEYLVVIPDEYTLSGTLENCGYFYYPGNTLFRVFYAQLEAGFRISEIDFEVVKNSSAIPQLRFADAKNLVRYGANVFAGKIPSIRIDNWNAVTSNDYFVLIDHNGEIKRIPNNLITDGVLNYSFDVPTQARIRLEPKGKTVKGFCQSSLSFSVVPNVFRFDWKNVLYAKKANPIFEVKPADKVKIVQHGGTLTVARSGKWQVNSEVDLLELKIGYGETTTFTLTVPVYRLIIYSEIIEDGILWQKNLNQRSEIQISLSPNEVKQNVEIGIVTADKFIKICDSKPVSNNLLLDLTTDEIRDAFEDCGVPAGLIAVKTRNGSIINSDIIYANEELIKNKTFDEDEKFDQWSGFLPDDLRSSIEGKRKAHLFGKHEAEEISQAVPESIKEWLEDPKPDFTVTRKSIREWSLACRNEFWVKAQQTEIGSEPEGRIITEAVKIYHDAIDAFESNDKQKYYRFLESSYKHLKAIDENTGLIAQTAAYVRFMCCLRLNEHGAMENEINLLDDNWDEVFSLKDKNFPEKVLKKESDEKFLIDDILIHKSDIEFLIVTR